MTREELLDHPLVAVFAVARPDGRVHATPVWYRWDGRDLNLIVERGSRRHRWAVEAGRAAVCIEEAKKAETRERRLAAALERLRA